MRSSPTTRPGRARTGPPDSGGPPTSGGPLTVLVTGHHLESPRRAGFHHLAAAYAALGHRVLFVTTGLSLMSLVNRGEHRRPLISAGRVNRVIPIGDRTAMYVWLTPWHPMNLRRGALNRIAEPLYRTYGHLPAPGLSRAVRDASLIIVESTSALLLVDRLRRAAPGARLVYRQSDELEAVHAHPLIIRHEARVLDRFDLISVPGEDRLPRFAAVADRTRVHLHGIDTTRFGLESPDPYPADGRRRCVFVGVDGLDRISLAQAAQALPDWRFDIVGPFERAGEPMNVTFHGEQPFARTVPYITHADIGLHMIDRPRPESFRTSLKVLQYTYARLPVVAPVEAAAPWDHVVPYVRGDRDSLLAALTGAASIDRERIDAGMVRSWEGLAGAIDEESLAATP